jgi:serine/threonine-protein kinase
VAELLGRLQSALGDVYRIERELGGGGMSRVFLASEASLHRQVVIKVLPPELASEVSEARFKQEIELAAHLHHTNILPVLAAGTKDDLLYYVMPFVSGESLRHRLTREGKLPVTDAVRILHEIGDALSYAHAEGVIHRDIKPENILLLGNHAVLMDFGVARALAEARSGERLTETGMGVGTPGYMSPEQAAGERHIDARADVYALAVVGYEMLAGAPPFDGPTAQAVLAAHLTKTARPVRDVRPEVPPAVDEAIARALAKDPAQRLQTAVEFRDALGVAVTGPDVGLTRPSLVRRFGMAALGVMAIAAGASYLLRGKPTSALDPNLLAVAPFDAVSSAVAEYREGLVTILSRSLDGAGPIRTLSPTVVVRRWAGQSDPASASALGHSTGAGLVVFGQVVTAGADSVRLSAAIYDVRRERPVGEVEVRDERQRIDRVADTLAVRVLRELGRTRPVGAVRFASLGSSSLPAIKLFLQAEQFYRHGRWDSTLVYARRAVALDSNFTLALRRIPNALWRSPYVNISAMLLREGAGNHGLAPRESLLVTVDSLWGALDEGTSNPWPLLRRLAGTLQAAVAQYPEDPEAWYMTGEMAYHYGGPVPFRLPWRTAFNAFAKAIELDSAFAPAYAHIVYLALHLQEPQAAQRYAEANLSLGPDPRAAASLRASLDLLVHPTTPSPWTIAFLDTVQANEVLNVLGYICAAGDSGEAAIVAARAFTASRHGVDSVLADVQKWALAWMLAYRGHLREAAHELAARRPLPLPPPLTSPKTSELFMLGTLPLDSVPWSLESRLGDGSFWAGDGLSQWAAIGDTESLHWFEKLAQFKSRSAGARSEDTWYWTYQASSVQPYLALAHRDTARALTLFAGLPDSICRYCYVARLKRAQILSARKRDREAAALLDEPIFDPTYFSPTEVVWALERGRVNERLNNRDKAIESYWFVIAVWRNADPELQPYVQEAKAALQRLGAELRR